MSVTDKGHPVVTNRELLDALRPGAVVMAYDTPWIKLSRGAGLWQSIDGVEPAVGLLDGGPVFLVWTATDGSTSE